MSPLLFLISVGAEVAVDHGSTSVPLLPSPSDSTFQSFLDGFQHYILHNPQLSLVIAFSVLSLLFAHYIVRQSSSYSVYVSSLYIYPIKGCAPIPLTASKYDRLGFLHDRRYMLVKRDPATFSSFLLDDAAIINLDRRALRSQPAIPVFFSQRTHPRMALLQPRIDEARQSMILTIPSQPDLVIPLVPPPSAPTLAVKVWADVCLTSVYESPAITAALTEYMGEPTVLVTLYQGSAATHHRPLDPQFDSSNPSMSIHAAFGDGYPFLLTTEPSLEALNAAVQTRKTPMVAFRPNIVVNGPGHLLPPWDEDYWKALTIEGQPFTTPKPCQRCAVPTIHPETGERDELYEPIQTMREQRAKTVGEGGANDGKVYFGMNCVQGKAEGEVKVGDLVQVLSRKKQFIEHLSDKKRD